MRTFSCSLSITLLVLATNSLAQIVDDFIDVKSCSDSKFWNPFLKQTKNNINVATHLQKAAAESFQWMNEVTGLLADELDREIADVKGDPSKLTVGRSRTTVNDAVRMSYTAKGVAARRYGRESSLLRIPKAYDPKSPQRELSDYDNAFRIGFREILKRFFVDEGILKSSNAAEILRTLKTVLAYHGPAPSGGPAQAGAKTGTKAATPVTTRPHFKGLYCGDGHLKRNQVKLAKKTFEVHEDTRAGIMVWNEDHAEKPQCASGDVIAYSTFAWDKGEKTYEYKAASTVLYLCDEAFQFGLQAIAYRADEIAEKSPENWMTKVINAVRERGFGFVTDNLFHQVLIHEVLHMGTWDELDPDIQARPTSQSEQREPKDSMLYTEDVENMDKKTSYDWLACVRLRENTDSPFPHELPCNNADTLAIIVTASYLLKYANDMDARSGKPAVIRGFDEKGMFRELAYDPKLKFPGNSEAFMKHIRTPFALEKANREKQQKSTTSSGTGSKPGDANKAATVLPKKVQVASTANIPRNPSSGPKW
ncbi:hypothetical protein EX30DRAFT_373552 [Ascodesmis nigricans]|uniref:Lysine-specific metallo-endopeptidase domain-containing protein n=1 Tax=Ascodesmis nigricans TaxID=341454 RepID=A0A4V3SI60_9PEZI|nr:hypothetical protein EX30DRAFT_373552 [Ascodesmis nigricans]